MRRVNCQPGFSAMRSKHRAPRTLATLKYLLKLFLKENVDIANDIEKKIIAITQGEEVVKDNTKEDAKESE